MAEDFIKIALEQSVQDNITATNAVKTDVGTVNTGVTAARQDIASIKATVEGHTTQLSGLGAVGTKVDEAVSAANTASESAANAYTAASNNANVLATINTNVSAIKTTIGTINTNTSQVASADACAQVLQSIVALDTSNLRYDALLKGIVMNHSSYGWLEMVAIAFNVDGENYVTLKASGPVAQSAWGSSGQDWAACTARSWCRGTFYNGIPAALRGKIKTVNKKVYTRAGSIATNAETVWLLSATELGAAGSGGGGVAEGAPYAYFNGSRALGASYLGYHVAGNSSSPNILAHTRSCSEGDNGISVDNRPSAPYRVSYNTNYNLAQDMVPCFCVGL